jgi:hypothetical protein
VSLSAPFALLGLLALPAIVWLHRRLRRPVRVVLPSLMFVLDEEEQAALERGRRLDPELWAALAAAFLLTLAAAGPVVERGPGGRRVRVVVAAGAPALARGAAERVEGALAALRADLDPDDRVEVVHMPAGGPGPWPRPAVDSLLAAARAGDADLRVVIDDRAPGVTTAPVRWVAVGDPAARNAGWVAASVEPLPEDASRVRGFANAWVQGLDAAEVSAEVRVDGGEPLLVALAPGEGPLRTLSFEAPATATSLRLVLRAPGDRLAADDEVALERRPLRVHIDEALAPALRERIGLALDATQEAWVAVAADAAPDLAFVERGSAGAPAPLALRLETLAPDAPATRLGPARVEAGAHPLARDLEAAQADLVCPRGAERLEDGEAALAWARAGGRRVPLLVARDGRARLVCDPLAGSPAPAETALWPLLVENFVRQAAGADAVGAGWRARGLLDLDASRLGVDEAPWRGPVPAAASRAERAPLALRTPLALAGALALGLLWLVPWGRRAGRARARGAVPARAA